MPVSPGRHVHKLGRCGPHAPTDEPIRELCEDPAVLRPPFQRPLSRDVSFGVTVWTADQTAAIPGRVRLGAGQVSLH